MNLGAEPKKVMILGALLVAGAVGIYLDLSGGSAPAPAPRPVSRAVSTTTAGSANKTTNPTRSRGAGRVAISEFRPRLGSARPEDKLDPASIDPELRLDLLAKAQAVEPVAAGRNLFQFGPAPAVKQLPLVVPGGVPKIAVNQPPPQPVVAVPSGPPPTPAPPPILLKYYGYKIMKSNGRKVAFLLDGEEILRVEENQTVKQHYRIVSIALKSIVIEDVQANNTQTLPLVDLPG